MVITSIRHPIIQIMASGTLHCLLDRVFFHSKYSSLTCPCPRVQLQHFTLVISVTSLCACSVAISMVCRILLLCCLICSLLYERFWAPGVCGPTVIQQILCLDVGNLVHCPPGVQVDNVMVGQFSGTLGAGGAGALQPHFLLGVPSLPPSGSSTAPALVVERFHPADCAPGRSWGSLLRWPIT